MEIRAKARRFRGDPRYFPPRPPTPDGRAPQPPLGLIVVDYLQLARGSGGKRDENRQQEIAEISRGLKALAKDLKVPIIAVSQLNREVEKREGKPRLSDLRESGAIEQDADMILFIHREDMAGGDGPAATDHGDRRDHRRQAPQRRHRLGEDDVHQGVHASSRTTRKTPQYYLRTQAEVIILVADGVGCGGSAGRGRPMVMRGPTRSEIWRGVRGGWPCRTWARWAWAT